MSKREPHPASTVEDTFCMMVDVAESAPLFLPIELDVPKVEKFSMLTGAGFSFREV